MKGPGPAKTALIRAAAAAVILFGAASCADPPAFETSRARMAVANLREVSHADTWAPDDLAAAEAALKAVDEELARQGRRFAVMRDYTKAGQLIEIVMTDAEAARVAAEDGKRKAESEAREALEAAMSALDHAWAALLIARPSRGRRSGGSRLDEDLSRAERGLKEISNMITAEQYREATARAEEILEDVSSLVRSVRSGGL